jgi:hypothetical protein
MCVFISVIGLFYSRTPLLSTFHLSNIKIEEIRDTNYHIAVGMMVLKL